MAVPVLEAQIEEVECGGWKNNVRLSNGIVELIVTLDVGPRILRFGYCGGPPIFGEFPAQLGATGERKWMIRGGHRLWVAPEDMSLTYELDNGPVRWSRIEQGIQTMQDEGPLTRIQKGMEIRMVPGAAAVSVVHTLRNCGDRPVECAPWALSVMVKNGTAIIPLPPIVPHDERVTPNQNWSLWAYTDLRDPRLALRQGCLTLRQDPARGPFKLGMAHREGWIAYQVSDLLFMKRFARDEGAVYPDGNVNCEVFTDENILELETLGAIRVLEPGDVATHEESWALQRGVQAIQEGEGIARIAAVVADAFPARG